MNGRDVMAFRKGPAPAIAQLRRRAATALAGRTVAAATLVVAALAPAVAHACGVCVEDKVAATYDHAVIHAAIEARRQVVFVALEGRDATRVAPQLTAAAAAVSGAQRGSVRVASSPPAFSFALARSTPPEAAVAQFRRAVAGRDVRMSVIRVMRDGVLVDPSG